ncbi:MAG TPA: zinc ribbon domain-containing protein [Blastocatellia bacterium]|nr:zinc ribbon domain-containing protein [Blastocatellia bacterium]
MFLILLLLIISALPFWLYSKTWGYRPAAMFTAWILMVIASAISGLAASFGLAEIMILSVVLWILTLASVKRNKRGHQVPGPGQTAQKQTVFCRRCGQPNPVRQNFCGNCGHELPDLATYELGDVTHAARETERVALNDVRDEVFYEAPSVTERTTSLMEPEQSRPESKD